MSLFDVNASNAADFDFVLSDGTPVTFMKVTSKNNIQVQLPDDHADAADDALRIFRRDGSHSKDTLDVTLSASAKSTAAPAVPAAPAAVPAPIASNDDDKSGQIVILDGAAYSLVRVGDLATWAA